MGRDAKGFTLIELMIVVVIIGILAAIAIPNFIQMQNRAKEGATKTNMHTVQLAAEDYGLQNDGVYSATIDTDHIANLLPSSFKNAFDGTTGDGAAWKDVATYSASMGTGSSVKGIVAYSDSLTQKYCIAGHGYAGALSLHLINGQ